MNTWPNSFISGKRLDHNHPETLVRMPLQGQGCRCTEVVARKAFLTRHPLPFDGRLSTAHTVEGRGPAEMARQDEVQEHRRGEEGGVRGGGLGAGQVRGHPGPALDDAQLLPPGRWRGGVGHPRQNGDRCGLRQRDARVTCVTDRRLWGAWQPPKGGGLRPGERQCSSQCGSGRAWGWGCPQGPGRWICCSPARRSSAPIARYIAPCTGARYRSGAEASSLGPPGQSRGAPTRHALSVFTKKLANTFFFGEHRRT